MPATLIAAHLDAKFHALADATRRGLVERLSRGPLTVKELAQPFAMTLPTVLKHLNILESGGLVRSEKLGRVRTFELAPQAFADVEQWVTERKRHWMRSFDRLEQFLAEDDTTPSPAETITKQPRRPKAISTTSLKRKGSR